MRLCVGNRLACYQRDSVRGKGVICMGSICVGLSVVLG